MRFALFVQLSMLFLLSAGSVLADDQKRLSIGTELRGHGVVPACDDPKVLARMTRQFKQRNIQYRESDLAFSHIEKIRETDTQSNQDSQNDRRFCAAHVHLTNGTHPTLYYLIQEHGGFASLRWGVDYCVAGLDEERAHGAHCRSLRAPF